MEADITTGKQYIDEEEERDIEFELNRERRKGWFLLPVERHLISVLVRVLCIWSTH